MNEQEMILRQKIEKREKFDTILAYVLLVILLGCIVIVLYLKFVKKEDTLPEEYIPKYIGLSDISSSLNSSDLANRYINDNATFNSNVNGNTLVVSYVKDDVNVELNIPMVGSELEITIPSDNSDIVNITPAEKDREEAIIFSLL